jgi:putative transposase
MSSTPRNTGRRHPVHWDPVEKGNRSSIIFLTVCTKDRQPLLASPECHRLLVEWWNKGDHWLAGKYVIMPDHVHLFCAPRLDVPLSKWVAFWKKGVARNRPVANSMDFWQCDFWDVQIRTGEHYGTQWEYMQHNPVRHGLVEDADSWPYRGEIHLLDWHDA